MTSISPVRKRLILPTFIEHFEEINYLAGAWRDASAEDKTKLIPQMLASHEPLLKNQVVIFLEN